MATTNAATRSNSFNEAFLSESYQDASTIITDLDKGMIFKKKKKRSSSTYQFIHTKILFCRLKISKYW